MERTCGGCKRHEKQQQCSDRLHAALLDCRRNLTDPKKTYVADLIFKKSEWELCKKASRLDSCRPGRGRVGFHSRVEGNIGHLRQVYWVSPGALGFSSGANIPSPLWALACVRHLNAGSVTSVNLCGCTKCYSVCKERLQTVRQLGPGARLLSASDRKIS